MSPNSPAHDPSDHIQAARSGYPPARGDSTPVERSPAFTIQHPASSMDEAQDWANEAPIVPLCAVFRKSLKQVGQKFTTERAKVLDAVIRMNRIFEADELLFEMRRQRMRVSKATIYRTLKLLMDAGIIEPVLFDQKQAHYQVVSGTAPRDQMICVETGKVFEFTAPELIAIRNRIAAQCGWSPVGHRFQIFAVSPEAADPAMSQDDSQAID